MNKRLTELATLRQMTSQLKAKLNATDSKTETWKAAIASLDKLEFDIQCREWIVRSLFAEKILQN